MQTVVLVCGGGNRPWAENESTKLFSESRLRGVLRPLPRKEIGATLAGASVIFLRRANEWAEDEVFADKLQARAEVQSFRILCAETFPVKNLKKNDIVVFLGTIDGFGWSVVEIGADRVETMPY